MTFFLKRVWILLLIGACQRATSQEDLVEKSSLKIQLDNLIQSEYEADRFHGTVVVGNRDSIVYQSAIGTSNRVWDIPMELNHKFDIASVNKSFFAALVLIAIEEGKLQLSDRLVDLLANFKYSGSFHPKITLHHMLTHNSGLPDYDAVRGELSKDGFIRFKRKHFSNDEYVEFISTMPPRNEPGEQFYYSNFAYHLMGIILEDVYGKDFSQLLQEKICVPLGLNYTFSATSNEEVHAEVVEGYNYSSEESTWRRNNFIDLTLGRRIFSTSHELYKWALAMNNNSILTVEARKLMQTNHLSEVTSNIGYGYGWVIYGAGDSYRMGDLNIKDSYIIHGGATEGFKSMLININEGDYVISFLSNVGDKTDEMDLAKKITHILMENR